MDLIPNFTLSEGSYKIMKFPSGELNVTLIDYMDIGSKNCGPLTIKGSILSSDNLMELCLLVFALKTWIPSIPCRLIMPYCAYSRQDRYCNPGEAFSLKVFANIINSLGFIAVTTVDNHSDVATALFDCIENFSVAEVLNEKNLIDSYNNTYKYFVSPDAGANKKVFECSKQFNIPMIRADKLRDTKTGKILETIVYANAEQLDNATVLIIDDICDGGRTFIELAKVIKEIQPNCKVHLYVTHGFFSKGLSPLFQFIDKIYTTDSICKLPEQRNFKVLELNFES